MNALQKTFKVLLLATCAICVVIFTLKIYSHGPEVDSPHTFEKKENLKIVKATTESPKVTKLPSENYFDYMYSVNELAKVFTLPPNSPNISCVIIIQTHNRIDFIRELIASLKNVHRISEALLIFSSDFFSAEIQEEIKRIKFTNHLRIFYPFSMQIYKDNYPGKDPRDCTDSNIFPDCNNHHWKDTYGHFRSANLAQIKIHWLWKLEFSLNEIDFLKDFQGPYLLLEEDYIVTEDLISVVEKVPGVKEKVQMVSLGSYNQEFTYDNVLYPSKKWISSSFNIGMLLNRNMWKKMDQCLSDYFCHFDDYNWDWSLTNLLSLCTPTIMSYSLHKSPRVLHIGTCGIHFEKKLCNAKVEARLAQQKYSDKKDRLYPDSIHISNTNLFSRSNYKNNGGFKDPRDITLCDHVLKNATDYLIIAEIVKSL